MDEARRDERASRRDTRARVFWRLWSRPIAVIALVCLLILAVGFWREWVAYEQQVDETKTALANLATSLTRDAEATIEVADTMVSGIVARVEIDGTSPAALARLDELLASRVASMTRLRNVNVLGPNGDWLASSMPAKGPNLSDRDWFRHGRDDPSRAPFIGPPVRSLVDQSWIITVSRRFLSADGSFAGIVVGTIEISDFVDHYAEIDLGPRSLIALMTPTGTLLARYPWDASFIGRDMSKATVFSKLGQHPGGSYATVSVMDGEPRYTGYRRSLRFPLLVTASMSVDRALAGWRANAIAHGAVLLVVSGIAALIGILLVRQMRLGQTTMAALRTSQEFLERTGRVAGVGGWSHDLATEQTYCSDETCRIYGVAPEDGVTAEQAVALFAPEARPVMADAIGRCRLDGSGWDLELPLLRADGSRIWVRTVGAASFADRKPMRIAGTVQDVTSSVLKRVALRKANDRIMLATETGGIGIWERDLLTARLVWDATMYRLYGIAPDNVESAELLWRRHVHPDDRPAVEQSFQDAVAGIVPYDVEFRVVWEDGSVRHIRAAARVTRDAAGTAIAMVGVNWDVTEVRQLAADLRRQIRETAESERRFRLLAENAGDVITLKPSFTAARSYVSPASRVILGFEPEELVGLSALVHVHPEDRERVAAEHASLCASNRTVVSKHRVRHKDGHFVRIEAILRLANAGTPEQRIVVTTRDMTESHRLEAERDQYEHDLVQSNADLERLAAQYRQARDDAERASRAKSRFLAGMSHELRTPLNGILGYAQLLHLEGGLSETQAARVDAMQAAGTHLLQMIHCVLDLSEIETEQLAVQTEAVDLWRVAGACLDLVRPAAEAKHLVLSLMIAPDVPGRVLTDPTRLRQILLNLLGNAVKFTCQGSICLRVRTSLAGTQMRFEVADSGPGIPAAQRHLLFQEFERLSTETTREAEGAGLGLALSAKLAFLMGGCLGHDDAPGGGSIFWLEMPLAACLTEEPARADAVEAGPAEAGRPEQAALRVLVVDDVAMNRDIAEAFLRSAGHAVTCAEGGLAAVAAVAAADFDIVLMDVRMPDIDGLAATRRIRALPDGRGRMPILALTAQAFTEEAAACREAGMDGHVSKPYGLETLLDAVARAAATGAAPVTAAVRPALQIDPPDAPPVLDRGVFDRTTAFLSATSVAVHLASLAQSCTALSSLMDEPRGAVEAQADGAHALGGAAGLFGFTRLGTAGRLFEAAVVSGEPRAPALAAELRAALAATLAAIPGLTLAEAALP